MNAAAQGIMAGRVVAVTGANSGIGRATAQALAGMGATVLACGRNRVKLDEAVGAMRQATGNPEVHPLIADLSVMSEVRGLANAIAERADRLDVLINNAGLAVDKLQYTDEGFELTFAVNHLAPFLLTNALLPLLKASAPARVVTVSSALHASVKTLDLDDMQRPSRYSWQEAYNRSKLANVLFTRALARRLEGSGVTANCLHPGVIDTEIGGNGDIGGLAGALFNAFKVFLPGPEKGARTSVYLATSPEVADVSGGYFARCKQARASKLASDVALGEELWTLSASLVG